MKLKSDFLAYVYLNENPDYRFWFPIIGNVTKSRLLDNRKMFSKQRVNIRNPLITYFDPNEVKKSYSDVPETYEISEFRGKLVYVSKYNITVEKGMVKIVGFCVDSMLRRGPLFKKIFNKDDKELNEFLILNYEMLSKY